MPFYQFNHPFTSVVSLPWFVVCSSRGYLFLFVSNNQLILHDISPVLLLINYILILLFSHLSSQLLFYQLSPWNVECSLQLP